MSDTHTWRPITESDPPSGSLVMTKIDDKDGVRNIQNLKRRNNMWFLPDQSMYVYYRPTHYLCINNVSTVTVDAFLKSDRESRSDRSIKL